MAGVDFSSPIGTSQFQYKATQARVTESSGFSERRSGEPLELAANFTPSFTALSSAEPAYHFAAPKEGPPKRKTEKSNKAKIKSPPSKKQPTPKLPPSVKGKTLKAALPTKGKPTVKPKPTPVKKKQSPTAIKKNKEPVITLVLDPGHGGKDIGTSKQFSKEVEVKVGKGKKAKIITKTKAYLVTEKNLDLQVARRLKAILKARGGYRVIMRRDGDSYMHPGDIAGFANKQRAHMSLSIHTNSAANTDANGFEVHMAENHLTGNGKGRTKSNPVGRAFAESIEANVKAATGAESRGIYDEERRPNGKKHLAVVNGSLRDRSLLFEMDYLTNPKMGKLLQDPAYQQKLALGLANGIEAEAAKIRAGQKQKLAAKK